MPRHFLLFRDCYWKGWLKTWAMPRCRATNRIECRSHYPDHPLLSRMWEKRVRGYAAMGYAINGSLLDSETSTDSLSCPEDRFMWKWPPTRFLRNLPEFSLVVIGRGWKGLPLRQSIKSGKAKSCSNDQISPFLPKQNIQDDLLGGGKLYCPASLTRRNWSIFASLPESVGEFWFGKFSKCVI